eukprot:m.1138002 g.1138002  ORF g.1138002 m.1138002 type:complete len:498 (-) comp24437_c1_seq17:68-1561(-)
MVAVFPWLDHGVALVCLAAVCGVANTIVEEDSHTYHFCRNAGTKVLGEHLSFTLLPAELTVAWHTNGLVCGKPCVHWALSRDHLEQGFDEQDRLNKSCGETQEYLVSPNTTAYVYHAIIGPLRPGQRYFYQVYHSASHNISNGIPVSFSMDTISGEIFEFVAPVKDPAPSATRHQTRVLFFGDSGNSEEWHNGTVPAVASEVASGNISMVIHTGDMAYYAEDDGGQRGGMHAEELSNATGHIVPLMTVPGNGDVFCYRPPGIPTWAACTEDYQRRYIMPGWNRTHSLWSAFDLGSVHYLLLDSEAQTWCNANQNQSEQLIFAEEDLMRVDRTQVPWVVVVLHRPLYSSCANVKEQQMMRDGFAALLLKYRVDLVLNGHVHSYERTWPVKGDYNESDNATVQHGDGISLELYIDPVYPVHVIAGTAGNGESIDDCTHDAGVYNWTFSAVRSNDIGYGRLEAHNRSHLEIDFFSVTQGKVLDSFVIQRTYRNTSHVDIL